VQSRDYRDIVAGGVLAAFGGWYAWYSLGHYGRGTLAKVGEGMFPSALGILLALLGAAILLGGLFRPGAKVDLRVRGPVFVILATAGFALLVKPFGLVPAIIATTVLSSLAGSEKVRPFSLLLLCAVLCVLCWLVFPLGLGLLVPMFDWPF
jgi:hypothetical protein